MSAAKAISAPSGEMSKSAIGSLVDGKTNHLSGVGDEVDSIAPGQGDPEEMGDLPFSEPEVPKPVGAIPGDVRFDRLLLEDLRWSRRRIERHRIPVDLTEDHETRAVG